MVQLHRFATPGAVMVVGMGALAYARFTTKSMETNATTAIEAPFTGFASGPAFRIMRPFDSSGVSEVLLPASTNVTPDGSGFPKTEPRCCNWTSSVTRPLK